MARRGGADNTILYSASNLASGTYVFPIATGDGAFQVGPAYTPLPGTFPDVIAFATGMIYDNSASALDAATNQVTAIYTRAAGFASPDAPNNRISYASFLPGTQASQGLSSFLLSMFNLTTGEPVGTANIYNAQVQGRINRMVRWGTDGLALATAQGQLVVLSGSLIAPGGTDSPKGTIPGTNPIYTPIAAVSTVPTVQVLALQAADMVWDPTHGVIYASIPSTATANAGSILTINATTGAVTSQVTTAASPGPLAISDNGEYLYVGEPGAYQRFILPAMTVDISVTVSGWAGGVPAQLSVAPGNPHLFTASFNNPGAGIGVTALFQDAQQVGINVDGGFVAWGPSAAVLYDLNNNGGAGGIYTYSVSASGLTQTALGNGSRFVTLNPAPNGLGMYYSNGLLYADTGAIYNIATQNTNGTFSLGGVVGAEYGVGPTIINQASNRAFVMVCDVYGIDSVCGNTLMSFNLSTYVPVVYGPVQGFNGYALRIAQTGATTFAALDPGGDIALVSGPAFGQ